MHESPQALPFRQTLQQAALHTSPALNPSLSRIEVLTASVAAGEVNGEEAGPANAAPETESCNKNARQAFAITLDITSPACSRYFSASLGRVTETGNVGGPAIRRIHVNKVA